MLGRFFALLLQRREWPPGARRSHEKSRGDFLKHHVETNKELFPEIRARPRREHTRVAMPLIYAFVARGPTVLAEHTSHSGNFATVAAEVRLRANLPTRWGVTRGDSATTRLEAFSTRATCPERRAHPRLHALRGRERDQFRTAANPARVPCRPPAAEARRAKRPTASAFFSAPDQISSLPASPAPFRRVAPRPPPRAPAPPRAFISPDASRLFPLVSRRRPCPR